MLCGTTADECSMDDEATQRPSSRHASAEIKEVKVRCAIWRGSHCEAPLPQELLTGRRHYLILSHVSASYTCVHTTVFLSQTWRTTQSRTQLIGPLVDTYLEKHVTLLQTRGTRTYRHFHLLPLSCPRWALLETRDHIHGELGTPSRLTCATRGRAFGSRCNFGSHELARHLQFQTPSIPASCSSSLVSCMLANSPP